MTDNEVQPIPVPAQVGESLEPLFEAWWKKNGGNSFIRGLLEPAAHWIYMAGACDALNAALDAHRALPRPVEEMRCNHDAPDYDAIGNLFCRKCGYRPGGKPR